MLSEPDILQSFHLSSQRLVPHRASLPTVSMSAGRLNDWNWYTSYVNTGDILTGSRNLRQYTGVISLLIRCNGGDGAVSQIGNLGDDRSAVAPRALIGTSLLYRSARAHYTAYPGLNCPRNAVHGRADCEVKPSAWTCPSYAMTALPAWYTSNHEAVRFPPNCFPILSYNSVHYFTSC